MDKIELESVIIKGSTVEYPFVVSDGIKQFFHSTRVFIDYGVDVSSVPVSLLTVPFVSCMSGLSWVANATIFVDEIDETYYRSYRFIKAAYQDLHHDLPFRGILIPSIIHNNLIEKNEESILLFGGGLDCQTSFIRHSDTIKKICNIYGWLESLEEYNKIDHADEEMTEAFAERMGTSSIHVRSNIFKVFNHEIIDKRFKKRIHTSYWYGFLHSMSFISIVMPICVVCDCSNVMIASSFSKGRVGSVCASLITTDSEFSFASNGRTIHDGFELSRQDKVRELVHYQRESNKELPLQVCSFNDHNCCECDKCFRTIVAIAAEGGDPHMFGFDYSGKLTDHLKDVMKRRLYNWGVNKETYYYSVTKQRILEDASMGIDQEFADWFCKYDFVKEHKKAKYRYYYKNLFRIIKRRVFGK